MRIRARRTHEKRGDSASVTNRRRSYGAGGGSAVILYAFDNRQVQRRMSATEKLTAHSRIVAAMKVIDLRTQASEDSYGEMPRSKESSYVFTIVCSDGILRPIEKLFCIGRLLQGAIRRIVDGNGIKQRVVHAYFQNDDDRSP